MQKDCMTRLIAGILTLCLLLGNLAPVTAFATDTETTEPPSVTEVTEAPEVPETTAAADATEATEADNLVELLDDDASLYVDSYADFMKELKQLETYAAAYAATSGKDAGLLLINFLRTGVDRYNDDNWQTLAGEEITEFTAYVADQDAANQTTAMRLRNIELFTIPSGQVVDFGHMFGTMNIAYVNSQASADLGGWAGDICDLLYYSKNHGNVPEGTVDEMAAYVLDNCFGVDADDAFGMDDFYGDLDAIYLYDQLKAGKGLSATMEAYFTTSLNDRIRSEYFLKNRFENLYTKESVREAVYNAYKNNAGLQILEAKRGLNAETDLRMACCYAFADYVYAQAGDTLEEPKPEEPSEPTEPTDPSEPSEPEDPDENPYYSVFSSTTSTLAPGITQTIKYAYTADNKQIAYYLANVDVTREDVTILAGYRDADPSKGWGMQRVVDQANAMAARHTNPEDPDNYIENFRVIVATNGSGFNMSTGEPGGLLVMKGKEWHPVNGDGFFAIMKDGSAMIGTTAEYATYKDQIQEAIAGFGSVLIKDGVVVAKNDGGRASRTAIGIKADGSVVMMVLDGRQEPFSAGGSMAEIAQIMKDAGCVNAVNLDGGGSTTFAAKPEGSDEVVVVNRPSDGYQRSVSTSLIAVSTAKTSNEFSYANITSDYDYLTVGTSLDMTAVGVSESGGAAAIPEGAAWQVSDATKGSVTEDGVFTAAANGDVDVQLVLDETVIGKKTLHVVVPDALSMEKTTMNVIYNQWEKLPLLATYQGNPVAFSTHDVYVLLQYSNAGGVDGLDFYIEEEAGYRTVLAGAALMADFNVIAMVTINCYRADEAVFDFGDVTAGNEQFAWNREITNVQEVAENVFQAVDTQQPMELSYVFAMDMTAIEIPEKLADLTGMLPGADQGKTAWDFLLQLAERVSTLTTVTVTIQVDPNLELDCSEMKISNDFFVQESATVDHDTNTVTISARWVDRTQAVDPSSANPVCILSGIKATPKDGKWDANNQLQVVNGGNVSYRIYLRASSLYAFANIPENQIGYDLHPFSRTLEDGTTESGAYFGTTYANFQDKFVLDNTNRQGWYAYDDQLFYFVDNKPLTGIQLLPGYEDPANKYFYEFAEDGSCVRTVSGLIKLDGELYYAINGAPKGGWVSIMNGSNVDYYFFNTWSFQAVNGAQKIGGYNYLFEDYILKRGDVVVNSTGTRYMWAGSWATQQWLEIDGKIAYARSSAYFQTGLTRRYSPEGVWTYYAFDDEGWWMKDFTGIYDWNGGNYLIKEGIVIDYPGLFELDGDYYYIASTNVMVKNRQYWISKTNGIVPEGSYWFDADGKMTMPNQPKPEEPKPEDPTDPTDPETPTEPSEPTEPTEPEPVKNGILEEDGELWYYVNGSRVYAGLIQIDGDYYYVSTDGQLKRNCTYWITKTNGLKPEGSYTFGADGKMIIEEEKPEEPGEKKNGILEEDGKLWYYVDGVKVYAGLIKLDGYFYYVRTSGELARSCNYWTTKNNGLMKSAMYTFDSMGRMTNPPADTPANPGTPSKDGIVEEDGKLWYYYKGARYYAGLIKMDGYYYYVNTQGEVKRSCTYWITKTNELLPEQAYTFDDQGRIEGITDLPEDPDQPAPAVKNGIVAERGSLYYYVDGKLNYAGLIYLDGYYYYVRTSGELAHDCEYWPTKHNDLFKVTRRYTFDSQGRMVDPPV